MRVGPSTIRPAVSGGFSSAVSDLVLAGTTVTTDYAFRPVNLPAGGSVWVYLVSNTGFERWVTGLPLGDHYSTVVCNDWPAGDTGRGQVQLRDAKGELCYTYGWHHIP
jgi:hypothetical protein